MRRLDRCMGVRAAATCLISALAACLGSETAVIVELTPDPAIASGPEIAKRLTTLQLLLDAEEGFVGVTGTDAELADFDAVDPDADGQTELLLELNVLGRSELPRVRVDAGRNGDRRIAIGVRGLDGAGALVASGSSESRALFVAGQLTRTTVPFDLVLAQRPPRVLAITPAALPTGQVLSAISIHASRPLAAATLTNQIALVAIDGQGSRSTVLTTLQGPAACAFGSEQWTIVPAGCVAPASGIQSLELTLGSAIQDQAGNGLVDRDGQPGSSHQLPLALTGFGPCTPTTPCSRAGRSGSVAGIDAACDRSTGRFGPAPCSVAAGGCLGDDLGWSAASAGSDAECHALRIDSALADGACVVDSNWPCDHQWDCAPLGTNCYGSSGYCTAPACTSTCAGLEQICTGGSCLPRVGTCTSR